MLFPLLLIICPLKKQQRDKLSPEAVELQVSLVAAVQEGRHILVTVCLLLSRCYQIQQFQNHLQ